MIRVMKKVFGGMLVMVAVFSLNEYAYANKNMGVDQEKYSYADQLDDEAYARELEAKQASQRIGNNVQILYS